MIDDRDKSGKLTEDSITARLIAGMPPSELTDKMHAFERLYFKWLGVEVDDWGTLRSTSWFTPLRRWIYRTARVPLDLFRAEIYELVQENTTLIQHQRNEAQRAGTYQAYLRLVEREGQLFKFLRDHYPEDLERGQLSNMTNIEVACAILLRLKGQNTNAG